MTKHRQPSSRMKHILATNVIRLRKAKGYTQNELAERCNLARTYVAIIEQERANVGMANLEALTVGLDCSIYDLFEPLKEKSRGNQEP
jgi:transcriptional regulator with XRE-family HTH domain